MICQIEKVKPEIEKEIEISGEDVKDLLFNWLQELISAVDVEGLFFSRFEITEISEKHLKAKCSGEEISKEKGGTLVKGVTYHRFEVERTKKGYKAVVSLDI